MKKSKSKRVISVMLILGMLSSVCLVATASGSTAATKSSLRSRGAIRYQEGGESVVIDSADLYTLADRLDVFKVRVAEQLGVMGTYLSKDGNGTPLVSEDGVYAVHQKPASGEADPLSLSFETILEGIAVSQSISANPSDYGMRSDTKLYKDASGKLCTNAQEGAEEICIQAATAENLSAGTAAWVNGKLILGTGGDNQTYHDLGCQEGSGGQGPENVGDVNKVRVINMNNGSSSYVVQEDMKDVFLCFSNLGGYTTPVLSSGESIKLVINNAESNKEHRFQLSVYYAPKLTKGTVISNLYQKQSNNVMSLLITTEGSQKNDKANGIRLAEDSSAKDYLVNEDMTDVYLYVTAAKSKMPDFIPLDEQEYVAFKLLKEVTHSYENDGFGFAGSTYGCLYYIPVLKAGTRISNINPYRSFLFY